MKEEWLFPNAVVPVDVETTAALVAEIKRLIHVVGGMALEISKQTLAQPAQEPDALTIAYQAGYHDGKKAALAGREWNFCPRCGKRTNDIHTCTPPQ